MGFRNPIAGPMAAMDAMLVPAENEPFGRTLIETMHLGTPVIATRHGGNIEAIEDGVTGRLVPLGDPEAMAGAVIQLERDPDLRARIVAAARSGLEERYGTARHVRLISALYEDLVPAHRRRGDLRPALA